MLLKPTFPLNPVMEKPKVVDFADWFVSITKFENCVLDTFPLMFRSKVAPALVATRTVTMVGATEGAGERLAVGKSVVSDVGAGVG